ncbi:MAG: hypothetical protein RLZZ437_2883 [Pseudomonadota bacterium]
MFYYHPVYILHMNGFIVVVVSKEMVMAWLSELMSIGASILIGLWLADFATGCFHWLVDNYGHPDWPIIGPHYIKPSHLHHDEDMFVFELSNLVTHLYIWTAVIIVGLLFWLAGLMSLTIIFACIFGFLTNVIHRWSHTRPERNLKIIKVLQRTGLFQSTRHHTFHHLPGSDSYYCLLTDHVNPILEAIGFWKILESVFLRFGVRKHWWENVKEPTF